MTLHYTLKTTLRVSDNKKPEIRDQLNAIRKKIAGSDEWHAESYAGEITLFVCRANPRPAWTGGLERAVEALGAHADRSAVVYTLFGPRTTQLNFNRASAESFFVKPQPAETPEREGAESEAVADQQAITDSLKGSSLT